MTKRDAATLSSNALTLLTNSGADYAIQPSAVAALHVDLIDTLFQGSSTDRVLEYDGTNLSWVELNAEHLHNDVLDELITGLSFSGRVLTLRTRGTGADLTATIPIATAAEMRSALTGLRGSARLPYSAIDGTPTIPTLRNAAQTRALIGAPAIGNAGLVPALPNSGQNGSYLQANGAWQAVRSGIDVVAVNSDSDISSAQSVVLHTGVIRVETAFTSTNANIDASQRALSVGDIFFWDAANGQWERIVHGGSQLELPAVSAANNGAVLKVANGVWAIGVDATGTGATGLTSVATDATIGGNGTTISPLSVANPFTAADERKLDGIAAGAQVNPVDADQNDLTQGTETANRTFSPAKIATMIAGLQRFTANDQTKLNSIAQGAEVNVQSDWQATSGDAAILNKPTIPTVRNASQSARGIVELATQAEARAGTNSALAITPDALAGLIPLMTALNRSTDSDTLRVLARSSTDETATWQQIDLGSSTSPPPATHNRRLGLSADSTFVAAEFTVSSTTDALTFPGTITPANVYIAFAVPNDTGDITSITPRGGFDEFAEFERVPGTLTIGGDTVKVWRSSNTWIASALVGTTWDLEQAS